jgi:hypothetical protein
MASVRPGYCRAWSKNQQWSRTASAWPAVVSEASDEAEDVVQCVMS